MCCGMWQALKALINVRLTFKFTLKNVIWPKTVETLFASTVFGHITFLFCSIYIIRNFLFLFFFQLLVMVTWIAFNGWLKWELTVSYNLLTPSLRPLIMFASILPEHRYKLTHIAHCGMLIAQVWVKVHLSRLSIWNIGWLIKI